MVRSDRGETKTRLSVPCSGTDALVQITGPQPRAGKQVTGVPVPGQGLKPAFGRSHVFANRSTLSFIKRFSRSVVAQRVRGRYSRLVQNENGEPASQPETLSPTG